MTSRRVCYSVSGGLVPISRPAGAITPGLTRPCPTVHRPLSAPLSLRRDLRASAAARAHVAVASAPLAQDGAGPPPAPGVAGGTAVVWFRSDLRVHDHPALFHALEDHGSIVAVFVFDPRRFATTHFGFKKTGTYRARFLRESVSDLRDALRARGSDLVVRVGHPETVVPALCAQSGARSLLFHSEVSGEERSVERKVTAAAREAGVDANALWSGTLYEAADVPFALEDVPPVYTDFRERVQQSAKPRDPLPAPDAIPPPPRRVDEPGEIPSMRDLGLEEPLPDVDADASRDLGPRFVGGESAALERLERYAREHAGAGAVHGRTAALHLASDFTCTISPWLAMGCLSPRRLYADLVRKAQQATLTTTYFELVWRDFFRFMTAASEIATDEARRRRMRVAMARG